MIRTSLVLLAGFGLITGCASSNANSNVNNPEAGAESAGGAGAEGGDAGGDAAESGSTRKPRDSTSTRFGTEREGVRKIESKKPPREGTVKLPAGDDKPDDKPEASPNGLAGTVFKADAPDAIADKPGGRPHATVEVEDLNVEADKFPGVTTPAGAILGFYFAGSLNVVEEGEYQLCLDSAGPSRLALDDAVIVERGADSAEGKPTCETVFVAAGEYGLALDWTYNERAVIKFMWGKDGADPEPVPMSALFKPGA